MCTLTSDREFANHIMNKDGLCILKVILEELIQYSQIQVKEGWKSEKKIARAACRDLMKANSSCSKTR